MGSFAVGDRVHIARIGTGLVREIRNGGRYLVDIKGRTMVVSGSQMERAASEPTRPRNDQARANSDETVSRSTVGTVPSLDLHGKTVVESLEALDAFLNEAILDSHAEVRVIHGVSGGRVRQAVHKRLGEMPAVRSFRIDPRNPGVTIVVF